ncbi:MAG TPA: RidA family protein [Chthoniobacterales bacterium]|jgi:2-iminobutanoate/2-iminopropanoate deaminase
MKKIISTTDAPAAIGPYSQAVRVGSMIFCAGQVPLDPKSGQIVSEDVAEQTRRVLDNISAVLKSEQLTLASVVKTTVFLADFGDFQKMNDVYATYFKDQPPARSTVGVSTLPKNARVEIEVIAFAEEGNSGGGKSVSDTSG